MKLKKSNISLELTKLHSVMPYGHTPDNNIETKLTNNFNRLLFHFAMHTQLKFIDYFKINPYTV